MDIKYYLINKENSKFNKLLSEMAIGIPGECNVGKNNIIFIKNSYNNYITNNNLIKIGELTPKKNNEKFDLYIDNDIIYISDKSLNLVGYMILKTKEHIPNKIKSIYNNISTVHNVYLFNKYRGKGIMKALYELILSLGISIMGDSIQYEPARQLWLSMNGVDDYILDIIDIDKDEVLHSDVKLNDIYDNRIWKTVNDEEEGFNLVRIKHNYIYKRLIISHKYKFN